MPTSLNTEHLVAVEIKDYDEEGMILGEIRPVRHEDVTKSPWNWAVVERATVERWKRAIEAYDEAQGEMHEAYYEAMTKRPPVPQGELTPFEKAFIKMFRASPMLKAIPTPGERRTLVGGQVITNVHPAKFCQGHNCTIHNPSDHHMKEWPQNWREDRVLMERMCPHGVGHPDPDDLNPDTVHGCDGCCHGPDGFETLQNAYKESNV